MVTEFGTRGHRDPCTSFFQRLTSYFTMKGIFTDNDLVNYCVIADQVYAIGDTPILRKICANTLDTVGDKVDMRNLVAVNTSTSHPHVDVNGDVYNIGSNIGSYNIVKFDAKRGLNNAMVVATIPTLRPLSPGYYHSFCMTPNYFVFIEQPVVISIPKVVFQQYVRGVSGPGILKWRPEYQVSGMWRMSPMTSIAWQTRFILVDRKSHQVLKQKYVAAPFAFFHTINAFEDDGYVIADICTYDSGEMFDALSIDIIDSASKSAVETMKQARMLNSKAERFVLPVAGYPRKVGIELVGKFSAHVNRRVYSCDNVAD